MGLHNSVCKVDNFKLIPVLWTLCTNYKYFKVPEPLKSMANMTKINMAKMLNIWNMQSKRNSQIRAICQIGAICQICTISNRHNMSNTCNKSNMWNMWSMCNMSNMYYDTDYAQNPYFVYKVTHLVMHLFLLAFNYCRSSSSSVSVFAEVNYGDTINVLWGSWDCTQRLSQELRCMY